MIQLTKERINQLRTPRGGVTRACELLLGIEFNERGGAIAGWLKRRIGTWVTEQEWQKLVAASKQYSPRTKRETTEDTSLFSESS